MGGCRFKSGSLDFATTSVSKPVGPRMKPFLVSWLVAKNFNHKSQPPCFGSTGSAYIQIDKIAVGAVQSSFRSQASLAVHESSPILCEESDAGLPWDFGSINSDANPCPAHVLRCRAVTPKTKTVPTSSRQFH
jgi:hypothetical protein